MWKVHIPPLTWSLKGTAPGSMFTCFELPAHPTVCTCHQQAPGGAGGSCTGHSRTEVCRTAVNGLKLSQIDSLPSEIFVQWICCRWCVLLHSLVHSTGVCYCTAWSTQLVCVTAQPGPLNWCVLLHSLVHSTGVCYTAQPAWFTQLVCVPAQPGPLNWCVLLHSLVHSTGVCYCTAWSTQLVCVTAQPGPLDWCVLLRSLAGPLNWCVLLHSLVHSTGVCYSTA